MKKVIFSLVTALAIVAGLVALPSMGYYAPYFVDVPPDYPYYTDIEFVRQNNIALGYTDGTFRPRQNVKRAEFVAMLLKASGQKASTKLFKDCYADVYDDWFANEVCFAKAAGWLHMFGPDRFLPGENVTVDQARAMITAAFGTFPTYTTFPVTITRQDAARMFYLLRGMGAVVPAAVVPTTYKRTVVKPVIVPPAVPPIEDTRDAYSAYNTFYDYYNNAYRRPAYVPEGYSTYPVYPQQPATGYYYNPPVMPPVVVPASTYDYGIPYGYGMTGTYYFDNTMGTYGNYYGNNYSYAAPAGY